MADFQGLTDPLSEREIEILACLIDGLSNREIAYRLHLSYNTIKWHNSQLYSKLGASNRDEAIERATTLGLLATQPEIPQPTGKHNLPEQITPFIGRQSELHELVGLLADVQVRLITILAPGGMGKTRLSLAVAQTQIGKYVGGVFFVPLAPLSSSDGILTAIANTVGFSFFSGETPLQQVLDYFREREVLLVLDNFEHLLEGISLVIDLIQAAPQIKVLVTSRERLNLRGEIVYSLRGLDFPTWETPEDALEYDAVKMFLQSAHRVQPHFELQSTDLDFMARICRLTEGMPLGIELAAGWVNTLTIEQIAKEIERGIDILETEMRDVPERQRSIRATFERTWDRLTQDEQAIFRRLSVFRGGFTAEAAEFVAASNLRLLRKLVNKALIQALPTGRYEIHELLRQFASDKLRQADEHLSTSHKHLDYFVRFAEEARLHHFGSEQLIWFDRLEDEIDNLFATLAWSLESSEISKGLRLAIALTIFFSQRHAVEGHNWLVKLFSVNQTVSSKIRAQALYSLAEMVGTLGDQELAQTYGEEALALARSLDDPQIIAHCLINLSYFTDLQYDLSRAAQALEEALTLFRLVDDSHGLNNAIRRRAAIAIGQGDYAYAQILAEEALKQASPVGHKIGIAQANYQLGLIAWHQGGSLEQARRYFEEAIINAAAAEYMLASAMMCCQLAHVEQQVENDTRSQALFANALYIFHDIRLLRSRNVDACLAGLGKTAQRQGLHERAAILLAAAESGLKTKQVRAEDFDNETFDNDIARARIELGESRFAKAWKRGKDMTRDQAISYALGPDFFPDETIFTKRSGDPQ